MNKIQIKICKDRLLSLSDDLRGAIWQSLSTDKSIREKGKTDIWGYSRLALAINKLLDGISIDVVYWNYSCAHLDSLLKELKKAENIYLAFHEEMLNRKTQLSNYDNLSEDQIVELGHINFYLERTENENN